VLASGAPTMSNGPPSASFALAQTSSYATVCVCLETAIWLFGARSGFFGEDRLATLLNSKHSRTSFSTHKCRLRGICAVGVVQE